MAELDTRLSLLAARKHLSLGDEGDGFLRVVFVNNSMPADTGLRPTIAIIGASTDRRKFGNKAVRAYLNQGYVVYPIHPTATEVEGLPVFRSILDVPPGPLDLVSIYLPPALTIRILDEVAQRHPKEVILNPGAESQEALDRAAALGLNSGVACSILAAGEHPADYQ